MNIINTVKLPTILLTVLIGVTACSQESPSKSNSDSDNVTSELKNAYMNDAEVTENVNAALSSDSEMKNFDISVATYKGTTTLKGTVDSMENMERVEVLVTSIKGVNIVNNELKLDVAVSIVE